ncbi:MAG TPA: hypothetical protein VKR58_01050 [Aquella sp.]|nr:hypothetical protein [Aquella sp.]
MSSLEELKIENQCLKKLLNDTEANNEKLKKDNEDLHTEMDEIVDIYNQLKDNLGKLKEIFLKM